MPRKRLILFTEGYGDVQAVNRLANRLLSSLDPSPWDCLTLDPQPLRVGGIERLSGRHSDEWKKKLRVAANRGNLGGVLLVLDGDADRFEHGMFCAWKAAVTLADRSKDVGGGSLFSVACVFARQEYESWIIAGVESLAGRSLPDGRPGVKAGTVAPPSPEKAPRDAKGWLSKNINGGYKPTTHQLPLTDMVDVSMIRNRNLRSFRRVENALRQLVDAIRSGQHVVTPLAAIGNADSQDSPPTR